MIDKKYNIIYADPPWNYDDKSCQGTMSKHYNGMTIFELTQLSVEKISDKNCILFLWATYPMLKEALILIKSWGFKYKSIAFQWIKFNKSGKGLFYGLGRWTRGNTEPCLLATKGRIKRLSASVFQVVKCRLMEHSKKPPIVRKKIIELVGDLPRIELFARERIDGWDAWGNEVKSDIKL